MACRSFVELAVLFLRPVKMRGGLGSAVMARQDDDNDSLVSDSEVWARRRSTSVMLCGSQEKGSSSSWCFMNK